MEEDVAHLRAAIEQLVIDPTARQQYLDLLSRIERSSRRAGFSADRTRKEIEVQFRLLSRTTDDLWTTRDRAANVRLYRLAAEILGAVEAGVFPPRVGWHCQDCPVRSRCWAWG